MARAWTNETAVMCDRELSEDLPYNQLYVVHCKSSSISSTAAWNTTVLGSSSRFCQTTRMITTLQSTSRRSSRLHVFSLAAADDLRDNGYWRTFGHFPTLQAFRFRRSRQ